MTRARLALGLLLLAGGALWLSCWETWRSSAEPTGTKEGTRTLSGGVDELRFVEPDGNVPAAQPDSENTRAVVVVRASAGSPVAEQTLYTGPVWDPNRDPVAGALVELRWNDGEGEPFEVVGACVTAADGVFATLGPKYAEGLELAASAAGFHPRTVPASSNFTHVGLMLDWRFEAYGYVLDAETGEPLEGATITRPPHEVRSAADGSYRIELERGRVYDEWERHGAPIQLGFRAERDGYADESFYLTTRGAPSVRVDVKMRRVHEIHARVVDAATGEPLPHVRSGRWTSSTLTDERGRCRLEASPGVPFGAALFAEGYGEQSWGGVVRDLEQEIEIPMFRPVTIEGRVVDETGTPVRGARVGTRERPGLFDTRLSRTMDPELLRRWPATRGVSFSSEPESASADASGHFALRVPPTCEPFELFARHPETRYAEESATAIVSSLDETLRVDFVLQPGATIAGDVLADGAPQRASLTWTSVEGRARKSSATDDEGRYVLAPIRPGAATVTIEARGATFPVSVVTLHLAPGEIRELDFSGARDEPATISGRVASPGGELGSGFGIWAVSETTGASINPSELDGGTYSIAVNPRDTYSLRVRHPEPSGMTLRRDGVEPGATGVDFVLPDAARLSLRLVDARSGRPLAPSHGWFAATVVRRPTGTSEFEDADGWMDADGVVAVSVLRGLPFDVGIAPSGAGFRSVTLEGLVVDGDERTIDVPLEPGFAVRVHARADEGAEPMREPHVLFLLRPGEQQLLDGPFTDVGIEFHAVGPFSIRTSDTRLLRRSLHTRGTVGGLEPGTYFLHAIPDDLVFEPATVTLDQSDDGAEIEFRWRPR